MDDIRQALRLRLSVHDPKMLTSPDGKRVEVSMEAIEKVCAQPVRVVRKERPPFSFDDEPRHAALGEDEGIGITDDRLKMLAEKVGRERLCRDAGIKDKSDLLENNKLVAQIIRERVDDVLGELIAARRIFENAGYSVVKPRLSASPAPSPALVAEGETLCSDCPPIGYPTDKTRCAPCPRRTAHAAQERK